MKQKIKTWLKRYVPAEIAGTLFALGGATITYSITENQIAAAYAGTISENIGFYGAMAVTELVKHESKPLKAIRNLILEFGPAEILDTLVTRPFLMYVFPSILNNFPLGIAAGKIAADIIFYIPSIIAYELRKKHLG